MILFLTLLWIGGLAIAVKANLITLNIWWKLSPLLWSFFLLIALMIPLQSWAPSGSYISGNPTIAIVPQVMGDVVSVEAKANVPMKKGETLFKIDEARFRTVFEQAQAALQLAKIQYEQQEQLISNGSGRQLDLDRSAAQMRQRQAEFERARLDLESTNVTAPVDGYPTNLAIRPGARVASFPVAASMAYVDTTQTVSGGFVPQNFIRFIRSGQQVEIALKAYPGEVFAATVDYLVPARATGLEAISGVPVVPSDLPHAPVAVRINPSQELHALDLPSGATGRMVIYSDQGGFAHVIRRVDIRIEAILNYVNPF